VARLGHGGDHGGGGNRNVCNDVTTGSALISKLPSKTASASAIWSRTDLHASLGALLLVIGIKPCESLVKGLCPTVTVVLSLQQTEQRSLCLVQMPAAIIDELVHGFKVALDCRPFSLG
jgi:hypothetical protein